MDAILEAKIKKAIDSLLIAESTTVTLKNGEVRKVIFIDNSNISEHIMGIIKLTND